MSDEPGADRYPELDPDRFDDAGRSRIEDLETLDGILRESELTEDDIEVLDAILKEGVREHHVEQRTGETKRGMDKI